MKNYLHQWLALVCGLVTLLFAYGAAGSGIEESKLRKSIVSVHAYLGGRSVLEGTGFVVHSDEFNGYVVVNANALKDQHTLTIKLPDSETELIAQVLSSRTDIDFALLKVSGMRLPSIPFAARQPVTGDIVWTANRWNSNHNLLGLSKGTLRSSNALANENSRLLIHDAIGNGRAFGSVLLNECGEVVGLNTALSKDDNMVKAVDGGTLMRLLKQQNVRPEQSTSVCISEIQLATNRAEYAAEEAMKAKQIANAAQLVVISLEKKLTTTANKNLYLTQQIESARSRAEQAIAAAERVGVRSQEIQLEMERKAVSLQAETQELVRQFERESALAEQRFDQLLAEQIQTTATREKLLIFGFIVFAVVSGLLIIVFQRKPFVGLPKGRFALEPDKPSVLTRLERSIEDIAEYVLDGKDDDGARYQLRIPRKQMGEYDGVVIGRNPKNSPFIINHADVSRKHVRLKMIKDRLFIEDLGSTNGTSVNGQAIEEKGAVSIINGDQIVMGSVVMNLKCVN
ncbi:MAG: FHA domain-containing protein [Pseudomonadales bacterium]|nr:FHA domain-containing protein [Pseudomonadales bacterium]